MNATPGVKPELKKGMSMYVKSDSDASLGLGEDDH